jgi:acyl-CoA synthetase (NDP forming)
MFGKLRQTFLFSRIFWYNKFEMQILDFEKTSELLKKYNIPFCQTEIFSSGQKAMAYANKIGYPIVLKVHGPNIFHKSDVGGVKTGIKNDEEFSAAWREIAQNKELKKIEGVLVQEMIKGTELVIGMKRDEQFGSVLMFGLGGIFIEILKDVAFRVGEINKKEALKMIQEIKGYKLLEGYRNQEGVNTDLLAEMIANVSKLANCEKQIVSIDFNPIMANKKSVLVADFRLVV